MKKVSGGAARRSSFKIRLFDNSDASWRQYGQNDPYYGVFSSERFRAENLNKASLNEFFESGEQHIDEILRTAGRQVTDRIAMNDALDFGCGVGRLVLPLARRFRSVAGVDISSDYRAEAKRNCDEQGIANVAFAENLSSLRAAGRSFDFIHSCIVFNHIPWNRGRKIISEMFELLRPGGVIAIQILHHEEMSRLHRIARTARKFVPVHWLVNLCRGHRMFEPLMQSNEYPLDELVPLLHHQGAKGLYIRPHSNQNREHWAFVFCTKDAA